MILEKQKEAMIHQDGEATESIGMSLDLDSAQVLMQMLSKNLYSDSIGSTIRECASNALDSHRRAGVDKPIVVALRATKDGGFEFSVEDFGIGLDAEDVKNIISKYGKSTKRNSSTELGMMGLGFKAPLAYTSSFYFVARKNGMERKYMMYEGEDVNTIDLLYETPTDQPNGVKVIVPVSWRDKYDFKNKTREQLAYFESVYFDVEDINNDFTIVRHQYFQFSELAKDSNLHICLDNVYYPMDFSKLGIDRINLPVALRFSLTDGIFPTPNRESIRYTQEAKTVILNRLKEASDYFIQKYNETITETEDVRQIVSYFGTDSREIKFGKSSWDVHPLAKFATIKIAEPKFKGTSLIEPARIAKIQEYILGEYEAKFVITRNAMRDAKHYYQITSVKRMADTVYVYEEERIPGLKKDYIKSLHGGKWEEEHVFRKVKTFKLRPKPGGMVQAYDNYYNILNLKSYPKAQWRQLIQEFQLVVKSLVATFIDLDALEVPQTFIDSRKKQRVSTGQIKGGAPGVRRIKLKGEMVCKQAEGLERWVDGKNCKWVSKIYDMATFHKNKFILVYGKQEDAEKMDKWFKATRDHNVELAILSERELKLVNGIELHNLMPFSKFMEGKNKPFERVATACLIDQLRDEYRSVFGNNHHLQKISMDLYYKTEALNVYHKKNFRDLMSDEVRNTIAEHALSIKAVDPEIYSTYKEVKSICEKFAFLNTILDKMGHYDSDSNRNLVQAITDLFKYHKHRIDWKNYNIRLNEDLPLEETLTTETVEELIEQD
jgi:hypothetical protein